MLEVKSGAFQLRMHVASERGCCAKDAGQLMLKCRMWTRSIQNKWWAVKTEKNLGQSQRVINLSDQIAFLALADIGFTFYLFKYGRRKKHGKQGQRWRVIFPVGRCNSCHTVIPLFHYNFDEYIKYSRKVATIDGYKSKRFTKNLI